MNRPCRGLGGTLLFAVACASTSPPPVSAGEPPDRRGPAPVSSSQVPAPAVPVEPVVPPTLAPPATLTPVFCAHGGAPLVGEPLVDARGRLHFVTQDGYLHSYEADGRFRFSYTVAGTPLGSPSLRESDGAILLGTTARAVYAITADGQLSLRAHTVTPVWSGLYALPSGANAAEDVVYIGLDRFLYALSAYGAARYRVPIPGEPTGEPVVDRKGVVWIPLSNGLGRIEKAFSVRRFPTDQAVEGVAPLPGGAVVLSGARALRYEPERGFAVLGPATALSGDGETAVWLDAAGVGGWLTAAGSTALDLRSFLRGGETLGVRLGVRAAELVVPLSSGRLLVLRASEHGKLELLASGSASEEPLAMASSTPNRERWVTATRSGSVCLLGSGT